jgi:hypothetical protein
MPIICWYRLRRWRCWDGYRRPWVQESELAGNPYQLGTGRAPSLLDLTSKHLLGDLSDAQVERTLRGGVAHDDQQQDLALVLQKQIFPADSRVHVAEGGGVVSGCRFSRSLLYTDANLETSSVCAWVENRKKSPRWQQFCTPSMARLLNLIV